MQHDAREFEQPVSPFLTTLSADGLRFGLGIAGGHAFMSGIWACAKLSKLSISSIFSSLCSSRSKSAVKQQ
jgi:hypothetical protein